LLLGAPGPLDRAAQRWWRRTRPRVQAMATAVRMSISMRAGVASGVAVPYATAGHAVARRVVVYGARDGTGGDVCAGDVTCDGTRS